MDSGFLLLITWLVLSFGAMLYAGKRGRSQLGFFILALFLSPLIAFVLLAASPSNPKRLGLKKCPACAEWVQPEALVCRFCHFDFSAPAQVPLPPPFGPRYRG